LFRSEEVIARKIYNRSSIQHTEYKPTTMMKPTPPIPLKLLFLLALYLAATGSSKAGALANAKAMAAEKTVVKKKKPVNRESRQCK